MNGLEGRPGELLDRLVELLDNDALGEGAWYDLSFRVSFLVGGRALNRVLPDRGPPVPGSVGEMIRQQHEVVSREGYFELVRERLGQLVRYGVEEAFLVRSLKADIRQYLESMADIETVNRKREAHRMEIERIAEDPVAIAEFRAAVADRDPLAESLSDDEIAARLRNMTRLLHSASPDEAVNKWALLEHWNQQAAYLLPETLISEWSGLSYRQ